MTSDPLTLIVLCLSWQTVASNIAAAEAPDQDIKVLLNGSSAFAKSNLHVWAYEEYDAVNRTPEERARLLKELGITKAGYIIPVHDGPKRGTEQSQKATSTGRPFRGFRSRGSQRRSPLDGADDRADRP